MADKDLALAILGAVMDVVRAEAAVAAEGPQPSYFGRSYTDAEKALSDARMRFADLLDRYVDARASRVAGDGRTDW